VREARRGNPGRSQFVGEIAPCGIQGLDELELALAGARLDSLLRFDCAVNVPADFVVDEARSAVFGREAWYCAAAVLFETAWKALVTPV
jgi:hypothetical protein